MVNKICEVGVQEFFMGRGGAQNDLISAQYKYDNRL